MTKAALKLMPWRNWPRIDSLRLIDTRASGSVWTRCETNECLRRFGTRAGRLGNRGASKGQIGDGLTLVLYCKVIPAIQSKLWQRQDRLSRLSMPNVYFDFFDITDDTRRQRIFEGDIFLSSALSSVISLCD